jgi:hypothetical protein
VGLGFQNRNLIATLNVVDDSALSPRHIGLSKVTLQRLQTLAGDRVRATYAAPVKSLGIVRKIIFGYKLDEQEIDGIVKYINAHQYSSIEIVSFLSVCAGNRLNIGEILSLPRAKIACGKHLNWPQHQQVFDKHCIDGLPGNRTTPLVVSIVSAAGLVVPKTSSRAITSPAGTADTLAVLTEVNLGLADIQRVVGGNRRLPGLGRRGQSEPGGRFADSNRACPVPGWALVWGDCRACVCRLLANTGVKIRLDTEFRSATKLARELPVANVHAGVHLTLARSRRR